LKKFDPIKFDITKRIW